LNVARLQMLAQVQFAIVRISGLFYLQLVDECSVPMDPENPPPRVSRTLELKMVDLHVAEQTTAMDVY
jgi:hypothetical protein